MFLIDVSDAPIPPLAVRFLGTGEASDLTLEPIAALDHTSVLTQALARPIGADPAGYDVADNDALLECVRSQSCLLTGEPVSAIACNGNRVAWISTPTGHLLEFVER